ncbi:glycogen debranching N-terminal domain-containing protein, partial [uncultured Amnibacterium sp.]|uniref:glycogen debranching N-terminal domain-containing protein n=1 Tax=uncultured Amnibacterium sp. TaxID=1631851 RepID=UPI0035CA1D63
MRQPLLHDGEIVLAAPAQLWSRADGSLSAPIDGLFVSDVRIVAGLETTVLGSALEHIRTDRRSARRIAFTALLRGLDADAGADPRVRLDRVRTVDPEGLTEALTVTSGREVPVEVALTVHLRTDLAPMPLVKSGGTAAPVRFAVAGGIASWGTEEVHATLVADGLEPTADADGLRLELRATVPPHGTVTASWRVRAEDRAAVVTAPPRPIRLAAPPTGDPTLDEWTARALDDLESLQLVLPGGPDDVFLAAGAPWFLTLFGRDSIWAARMP